MKKILTLSQKKHGLKKQIETFIENSKLVNKKTLKRLNNNDNLKTNKKFESHHDPHKLNQLFFPLYFFVWDLGAIQKSFYD